MGTGMDWAVSVVQLDAWLPGGSYGFQRPPPRFDHLEGFIAFDLLENLGARQTTP
jgi:hypothetical protein